MAKIDGWTRQMIEDLPEGPPAPPEYLLEAPREVLADWLEENGHPAWAAGLCRTGRLALAAALAEHAEVPAVCWTEGGPPFVFPAFYPVKDIQMFRWEAKERPLDVLCEIRKQALYKECVCYEVHVVTPDGVELWQADWFWVDPDDDVMADAFAELAEGDEESWDADDLCDALLRLGHSVLRWGFDSRDPVILDGEHVGKQIADFGHDETGALREYCFDKDEVYVVCPATFDGQEWSPTGSVRVWSLEWESRPASEPVVAEAMRLAELRWQDGGELDEEDDGA